MHSLQRLFVRVLQRSNTCKEIKLRICQRKLLPLSLRALSTRQDDGYYSERGLYDDEDETYHRRSPRDARFSGQRRSQPGSQYSFGRTRGRSGRAVDDDYEESENPSYDEDLDGEWGSRTSRFGSSELGAKIKKKEWDVNQLPPLEKNFYVEHQSHGQKSQEDIDEFYTRHHITVKRGPRPIPVSHFHEANFPDEINQQLKRNEWAEPTPIQSLGWPLALSGRNMVGIAQTGSGKTLGFILPALVHIKHQRRTSKGEGPIALILAPTRELAQQIKSVAVQYGKLLGVRSCCLFGGQSKLIQARQLSEGPEIVVATPGRLLDFLEMDAANLDRTSYVVLDEADRMLDMGFEPQIRKVLGQIRPDRQMLMWSATWPKEIQQLAHDFLGEFTQVNIGSSELMANPNIEQIVRVCERHEKFDLMVEEMKNASKEGPQKTLIFAQTKMQTDILTDKLRRLRFRASSIHGDKTQLMRDKTLASFKAGDTEILVATDVAARGLDVNDIKLVINFDYPNTADDYIHRIGRTARAAKVGTALTFVSSEDAGKVDDLIKVLKEAGQEVSQDLLDLGRLQSKFGSKAPYKSKFNQYRKPYNSGFNRRNSW